MRRQYGSRRERSRVAAETTGSQNEEGPCERNHRGQRLGADPGGAFRARDVSVATTSPPQRSRGRGFLPHADLTSLGNRGGRACDVRASSGARQRVVGVFRVRGCLPEAFKNLIGSFCCFSQGCCTVLSAFLWGVIIALSMRSWVTSPRVTEIMGGRGGKSKSKPCP